jgi:N-acetylated-alpha-linked acidic dipeptidase
MRYSFKPLLFPAFFGILILGSALLFLLGAVSLDQKQLSGFFSPSLNREFESEKIFLSIPSAERFGGHLLYLTEEPHQAGTPRNMELAAYVRDQFLKYGLENVHFHDTPALLSYGQSVSADIVRPVERHLKMAEDPNPEDKDSYLYTNPAVVPYNEYSASGDVTAEVIYANGGSPEDFQKLVEMGVDCKGKIIFMRNSTDPYSYRGYKVYMAESHGAAAAVVYSDPQDDGYVKGTTYPEGSWGPASHCQWGSIIYDWFGFGSTPFTFHWKQQKDGTWVEGPVRDKQLPRIPSVPMSFEDAAEVLSRLKGPSVPEGWQGGLPFAYHIGPGPVKMRLMVKNIEKIATLRNVIGMVKGTEEPEKWVIAGNHRDAWIYGAYDPSSGTAALLEVAMSLGQALRQGFRPKRTIVLANWDAEEDLLGGSTSWVKDNRQKLVQDGVIYVNVDSSACGPDFGGGSTPALADFLRETTKSIPHPDSPKQSVFDVWAAGSVGGIPEVDTIVGATDYTAFQENIGMSCVDMSFHGPYGVYHSMYDNYFWMSRIADPGFRYNTTMSRLLGLLVWRMANVDILPIRYSNYAQAVLTYLDDIEKKAGAGRALRLEAARGAAEHWLETALFLEEKLDRALSQDSGLPPAALNQINAYLMDVERALTEEEGLKSRPYYKHLIYAPQPTYRREILPRIFEAIENSEWDAIVRHENQLVKSFNQATALLQQAASLVK